MKSLIFALALAAASIAQAVPTNSSMAANEIGLCGFSLPHFFASKAFYRYEILPSVDIIPAKANPADCANAVSRLEKITKRTAEENTLLGVAATAGLATTLRVTLDKNESGDIDDQIDVRNSNSLSDAEVIAIIDAQRSFLKYAPLVTDRADIIAIAANVTAACGRAPACALDPADHSPRAIQLMRDLLAEILK